MTRTRCSSSVIVSIAALLLGIGIAGAQESKLWGANGENFKADGRLMDWSYAGYHAGEAPLPWPLVSAAVTEFGAVPDDGRDDTQAFVEGLASLKKKGGVLYVPAGEYTITSQLKLTNGVVLRGESRDNTTLYFPKSFTELRGNPGLDSGGTSDYSIEPGFIRAGGAPQGAMLGAITRNADRGSTQISVTDGSALQVGDWVLLRQTDVGGDMLKRMHADLITPNDGGHGESWHFANRVRKVDGNTVTMERPLPLDIDRAWSPVVLAFAPTTSEVGIENLRIRFPETKYPGHFEERGYNAIQFHRVANSWIRSVYIVNADNPIKVTGSFFVTVQHAIVGVTASRGSRAGHHGITVANGSDVLVHRFAINAPYVHDVTTTFYATGTVFSAGSGSNLNMDHHSRSPYATLWTDMNLGAGSRPFASSGARHFHPHTAAYATFWNVHASRSMALPENDTSGKAFGPRLNFIGFQTTETSGPRGLDWWIENIDPGSLKPTNLWGAMRSKRLGDRLSIFSDDPQLGNRSRYRTSPGSRWDVVQEDGDARLRINTSAYEAPGDKLGSIAVTRQKTEGDFVIRVSAKTAESLKYNDSADYALVFGYQDPDNYFYLLANARKDFSQLFRVVDSMREELATAEFALIPDQDWHELSVTHQSGKLIVSLDGQEAIRSALEKADGLFGVGSYNDAAFFDDISLASPDAITRDAATGPGSDRGDRDSGTEAAGDITGGCNCQMSTSSLHLSTFFALMLALISRRIS